MHGSRQHRRGRTTEKDDSDVPPDPSNSNNNSRVVDRSTRCMLDDIDATKLSSTITGHPAARGTALLLQAVRQQVSVASCAEYSEKALDWIVEKDVLMLKMRKHSVFCRVLQSDAVDAREQMARLVNTIASYAKGRDYFSGHLRTFLPSTVAILRGRRLPCTTHDQLIATLQKMSVRSTCQRELLQCGMLEWIVNLLQGKPTQYASEYAVAMAVNLCLNSSSLSIQLRFADSLSSALCNVLKKGTHGPACSLYNSLVLTWLGCSRVRLRAKETKLVDAVRGRIAKRYCALCALHVPYLLAIIAGEAEINKVPQAPNENDNDTMGTSCEHEVDSLDPLRPSHNELSGARLLLRRAQRESCSDLQPCVPGQVPRHINSVKTTHTMKSSRGRVGPRLSTAASTHTFVIETARRKPLLLPVGLTDGALDYRKTQDAAAKAREEEEKRLEKEREREKKEAAEKERLRLRMESRKPPVRRDFSHSHPTRSRTPVVPRRGCEKAASVERIAFSRTPSETEKEALSVETPIKEHVPQRIPDDTSAEDYIAVFGSRPKVARTPEHTRSFF